MLWVCNSTLDRFLFHFFRLFSPKQPLKCKLLRLKVVQMLPQVVKIWVAGSPVPIIHSDPLWYGAYFKYPFSDLLWHIFLAWTRKLFALKQ